MYLTEVNIVEKRGKQKSFLLYLNNIIAILLAAVLIFSGINKTIAPSSLIESISIVLKFLPKDLLIIIAVILPFIEIGLGILLIVSLYDAKIKRYRRRVNLSLAILFGLFLAYSIYGYAMGISDDCGCFGNSLKSDFNTNMVTRNSFLFLATVFSYFLAFLKKSK